MSGSVSRHPGLTLGSGSGRVDDEAETQAFGFWVFMMSDAVLFGLLIATYVVMRPATNGGPGPPRPDGSSGSPSRMPMAPHARRRAST